MVLFEGTDSGGAQGLWVTDGTAAGTSEISVTGANPGGIIPSEFTVFGNKVVFAGYGITAPEYGYDDYAGIDVKGKIVLVLRHEPQEYDEKTRRIGNDAAGLLRWIDVRCRPEFCSPCDSMRACR